MNAPLSETNIEITSEDLIEKARLIIARDDQAGVARADQQRELHMDAAEALANAYEMERKRWTQRAMAEAIGKSPAWVNKLLAWRAGGYVTQTAFGPQSKERDEKRRLGPKHNDGDDCPKCELPEGRDVRLLKIREKAETDRAKLAAEEAKANARTEKEKTKRFRDGGAKITEDQRDELIQLLRKLVSDDEGERANAAKMVAAFPEKIGVSWSDLIVEATQ